MSVADKARKVVQDMTGMWWPAADEGGLRDAAKAWRNFADDVDDVTSAANKAARSLIENNKGEAISAFDDPFWRRYYHNGDGWLKDLADAARDMAKALDAYADAVHSAKKKLEHELEIVGATLVAGTALAIFTAGISEGAAAAAAVTVADLAAGLGVTVSTEIATIAGTTLATAAFAGVESVTVDLAVTQPVSIALGESKGFNLDEAGDAGLYGMAFGGMFGAGAGTVRAATEAGGFGDFFAGLPGFSRSAAELPEELDSLSPDELRLIRQDDDFGATHNPLGLKKSRFDPDVGLIPADPDGEITPLQHVLGGKNKAAKESSQYTSFAPQDGTGKVYGSEEIRVDYQRLQKDIDAGHVHGVEILPPQRVQQSIGDEIDKVAGQHVEVPSELKPHEVSDFVDGLGLSKGKSRKVTDRVMAMLNTRRDGEWLISGVVPKDYITGPYPTSRP
ncbi:WXG100 family type VII secretion target [Streptomyces bungoensis]